MLRMRVHLCTLLTLTAEEKLETDQLSVVVTNMWQNFLFLLEVGKKPSFYETFPASPLLSYLPLTSGRSVSLSCGVILLQLTLCNSIDLKKQNTVAAGVAL